MGENRIYLCGITTQNNNQRGENEQRCNNGADSDTSISPVEPRRDLSGCPTHSNASSNGADGGLLTETSGSGPFLQNA